MSAPEGNRGVLVVGALLNFVDADHVLWSVEEHDARGVPGSRGERCLLFASEGVFRRVWDYPQDWRELLPPMLATISWRR